MAINNHFLCDMDIVKELNCTLLHQEFPGMEAHGHLAGYQALANGYAVTEQAIAVLSDMRSDTSFICYGGLARVLGISAPPSGEKTGSIWEEAILRLVHPDDLRTKYIHELHFFSFVKRQPKSRRSAYFYAGKLRMKDSSGDYRPVLHRIFYFPSGNSMRLSLCLYTALWHDMPPGGLIVDSSTGQITELVKHDGKSLLSARERQVLRLVDQGLMSKQIASGLSISIHTVNRHRQEILGKLQVKNSIEACRIAKELGII